jgi:GMP reductase
MKEYLDFQDVLLMPEAYSTIVSREEPDLEVNSSFPFSIANMEGIGTLKVAQIAASQGWNVYIDKHTPLHEWKAFFRDNPWTVAKRAIPTFGCSDVDLSKLKVILHLITENYGIVEKTVCFDFANGNIVGFWYLIGDYIIKNKLSINNLVIGNIGNPKTAVIMAKYFIEENIAAKIGVKVGIGSGSVCTTRLVTGIGVPQFTLVNETRNLLENSVDTKHLKERVYVISDGGIRNPGDVVKAFVAGAHEVMMGGMFAGLHETTSDFHGSSSAESQSFIKSKSTAKTPEGKSVTIKRDIGVLDRIKEVENGVRSAMTYLNIKYLEFLIDNYHAYAGNAIMVRRQTDNY